MRIYLTSRLALARARIVTGILAALALLPIAVVSVQAEANARKIDDFHWEGVERVVAVGDLHGDYQQYLKVLRDAGLITRRGRWDGGRAHLVQTGDVPDRGPDTREIIEHLQELKKQASRKGGQVHTLIGNHEAMNSYGDLRYVHAGEYKAFISLNSEKYRERQWEGYIQRLEELRPEEFLVKSREQLRAEFEQQIPLGWVEHRLAWRSDGALGQWILGNPVAVMVNDTIFLHGGISASYCSYSLQELTELAHRELQDFDPSVTGILVDEEGPLWYRGLAQDDEGALSPVVDRILERYGANRIVVGHTPTGGVVWPRFGSKVIVNDTGIAAHYGGRDAYLDLSAEGPVAGYGEHRLSIPSAKDGREDYLRAVIDLDPGNAQLQKRLERMLAPPGEAEPVQPPGEEPLERPEIPVSPDICR
ncbi:MAG: protein-tyrosine-phosphatase [Xanthomonadales bacterium]|nr:protein-tyrosine-phosphatase [Xanthomonadales bacterium]NIX11638.1 protein-tyrosine-phosphatase [Xanthomonadales bacterium]